MNLADHKSKQWVSRYIEATSWEGATRVLMLASKQLNALDEDQRSELHEISGCESRVWLKMTEENKLIQLKGYSDGKIVRGLIQLIFEPVQNVAKDAFCEFDFDGHLINLNLEKYLSPSRNSGVAALVAKLKQFQQDV
ncbi:SufE family protein [Alteromonas sp. 5E99-2]|uniref:SufE family protein n=1 Tax=Alteromonas sp. 5E99-2 TaxID=2817683 RepID=UPI001A9A1131|nr:SufE family protein [Alteromonas sp. 5E99-2]MBO1254927.1 SufE family protein [Alteromonas sp. 5E99-2]